MCLESTYNTIKKQWVGDTQLLESVETVKAVQAHRDYWKPDEGNVQLILLAESHVFTPDNERATTINFDGLHQEAPIEDIPTEFVRFIYCLGYGENELLDIKLLKNTTGSPQFWKLFQVLIGRPENLSEVLKSGERDFNKRVSNKLDILTEMKKRGIWLLDASVVALYPKEGRKKNLRMAVENSFKHYIKPLLDEI
jgi:hypothetical protein